MPQDQILIRNKEAAWQEVEDNIVVITQQTKKIHVLSGCGLMLWQRLEQSQTKQDLLQAILDEYEVEPAQAQADLDKFLEEVIAKDIIRQQTTDKKLKQKQKRK
ncbi:MAG: PqqD family protein [Candidatus Omnitrophota bacterium]